MKLFNLIGSTDLRILQWNTIANDAQSYGFKSIRLTGFDCGALDLASFSAASHGLTILAGLYYSVTSLLLHLSWSTDSCDRGPLPIVNHPFSELEEMLNPVALVTD